MIAPKFIRFNGEIVNIVFIVHIYYTKNHEKTYIDCGQHGNVGFKGDVRDELWGLIKLAMQPKDVAQPYTIQPEERVADIKDNSFAEKHLIWKLDQNIPADMPSHVGFTTDGTLIYERNGVLITVD